MTSPGSQTTKRVMCLPTDVIFSHTSYLELSLNQGPEDQNQGVPGGFSVCFSEFGEGARVRVGCEGVLWDPRDPLN
jgi:hypothetical protein